jgi:hypothetical protein
MCGAKIQTCKPSLLFIVWMASHDIFELPVNLSPWLCMYLTESHGPVLLEKVREFMHYWQIHILLFLQGLICSVFPCSRGWFKGHKERDLTIFSINCALELLPFSKVTIPSCLMMCLYYNLSVSNGASVKKIVCHILPVLRLIRFSVICETIFIFPLFFSLPNSVTCTFYCRKIVSEKRQWLQLLEAE